MPAMTQDALRQMNEADLRQHVIMPLMERMGYRGVHEWHGSVGELGKDVLGWKEGDFGDRTNVAVVAKAARISGATVHEVTRQVRQALNTSFEDPITHEQQQVHTVWVVTNKEAPTDSRPGLFSDIDPSIHRHVRIIDGDELWRTWKQHFPVELFEALEEAQLRLANLDSDLKVEVSLTPLERRIAIAERYPGQLQDEPIEFSGSFQFPKTPEGKDKLEELQTAFATGATVRVPGEFVQLKFPEALQRLAEQVFGGLPEGPWSLEISSGKSDARVPISVEFECDDGDSAGLAYVELTLVQAGTNEITLTNDAQAFPIQVRQVINFSERTFRLSFGRKEGPIAAPVLLQLLRILECLGKPCHVRVTLVETGLPLSEERRPGSEKPVVDPEFLALVTDLVTIQEKVHHPIYIPDRNLTPEEWETITLLRSILREPEATGTWENLTLTATGRSGDEDEILGPFLGVEPHNLRVEEEQFVELFGSEFSVGHVRTIVQEPRLMNEQDVREQLAAASDADTIVRLLFEPGRNNKVITRYLDWEPESLPLSD